jgi:hypothetical protein
VRKITLVLLLTALAGTAHAQVTLNQKEDPYAAEDMAKKRDAAILDSQYRRIMELTKPGEPAKYDPWADLRGPSEPPQANPKAKAKTNAKR